MERGSDVMDCVCMRVGSGYVELCGEKYDIASNMTHQHAKRNEDFYFNAKPMVFEAF